MLGSGGFSCPRCRMAFSSRPLLRAHEEKLCLGTPTASSSCLPRGDPPPAEETAGRLQDASVAWSRVWRGACGDGTVSRGGQGRVLGWDVPRVRKQG